MLFHLLGPWWDAFTMACKPIVWHNLSDHEKYSSSFSGRGEQKTYDLDLTWCDAIAPSAPAFAKEVGDVVYKGTYDWKRSITRLLLSKLRL